MASVKTIKLYKGDDFLIANETDADRFAQAGWSKAPGQPSAPAAAPATTPEPTTTAPVVDLDVPPAPAKKNAKKNDAE